MVVYEQYAEKGSALDNTVMILNPALRSNFIEDDDPEAYFASGLLLYNLFQLEQKFGRKWGWIEMHLKNNPLFRSYKISQKLILKLSIFLHMLLGERLILNYRQLLPYDRMTNLGFFPADSSTNKKKASVGRKKKARSNEKEEQAYRSFVDRIEREKGRLSYSILEDETTEVSSIFFNKMKFSIQQKLSSGKKRFKPMSSTWSNWKNKEGKADTFAEKVPDGLTSDEKKAPSNTPNYPKYLKKRSLV